MTLLSRITALFKPEPAPEAEPSDFGCALCSDTGWVLCTCGGDLCTCDNYGEMRCPKGCAEAIDAD